MTPTLVLGGGSPPREGQAHLGERAERDGDQEPLEPLVDQRPGRRLRRVQPQGLLAPDAMPNPMNRSAAATSSRRTATILARRAKNIVVSVTVVEGEEGTTPPLPQNGR